MPKTADASEARIGGGWSGTIRRVFERFSQRARQVVVHAQEEASGFQHNYLGTEHILLGLLRYEDGIPARVLGSYGVTLEEVRGQVEQIIGRGETVTPGQIPFTPRAKKVLELSMREAQGMGHGYIGTEHVLLGLLREGKGVAVRILADFASPADIRTGVLHTLSGAPDMHRRPASRAVVSAKRNLVLPLVLGWLLFATALGVGILIGWAIWS